MVAVDRPAACEELRTANLVFVVGYESDQIVVGGSGKFASARG